MSSYQGKCDVCGRENDTEIIAGRWVFYCKDNPKCKQFELDKQYDNELAPAMENGEMPDCEVLENFI